jgi:hypothetical protein
MPSPQRPGDPTAPPSSGAHSISSDECVGANVAGTHGRPGMAGNKDGAPAAAVGNAKKNNANAKNKISSLELKPPLNRSSNKYSNLEFFRMLLSHTKVEVIKAIHASEYQPKRAALYRLVPDNNTRYNR